MFHRIFCILAFLVVSSFPVQAAGGDEKPLLQREDFAYGMELSVSGNNSIYGLLLPAEVYQGCTRADLGDLRVFNAQYTVPYVIRSQVSKKTKRAAQALPFFPLFSDTQDRGSSPPDLHIATNGQGTIIDIRQHTASAEKDQVVTAYILDTSGLEYPADWLELTWAGQGEQFSTSVRLDSSKDLNSWSSQVSSAALAELRFEGHSLLRTRIMVPQGIQRKTYLRLSWPAGKDGVKLTSIKAGYNREARNHPRTFQHLTGTFSSRTEQGMMRYQYDSKGFFPVDQLRVHLAEQNSLGQITLFSRVNEEAPWQRRTSFLAYRLTVDGVSLDNGTISINRTTDQYWRLEVAGDSGIRQMPTLELGWLPGQLLFLAQGEQPYTLAYGRAGLQATRYQVDRLLKAVDPQSEKKLVAPVQAGPEKILGGGDRRTQARNLPWQQWLLWVVLIAGVVVVGLMALKLYREMQGKDI
ncbi:DUF3999 domain-containing protein [Candidatus Electrothrix sp.]|uniref:DUF3999 domain-containing protein n=1 Tax=Candidatus Electrothrix sp. TaxID=2170559 RepID=UPI0040573B51